jgi:hypothetical protein
MGVVQNARREFISGVRVFGATVLNSAYPQQTVANYHPTGAARNITWGEAIPDETVGVPYGVRHPTAWVMPQKPGALASRNEIVGEGGVTAAEAWAVKLAQAALTGTGELTATGGLIVQLIAAIAGSGTISDADIKAFLQLAAAISGTGDAAGDASGLGALIAALTGTGAADGSTATGTGNMSADLVVTGTGLTTANVGPAVWAAIAALNNTPGSMGEKLNDAGSASNPWTEVIEGGYTAAQMLKLIAAAAAGELAGAPAGPIEIKGVDGATTRITATVDGDGNRLTVTYDVS